MPIPVFNKIFRSWALMACVLLVAAAEGAEPSGRELVAHVERLLWGKTNQGQAEMTVVTPRWTRTLELRFWMERPARTFIDEGKLIGVLEGSGSITAQIPEIVSGFNKNTGAQIIHERKPQALIRKLAKAYTAHHYKRPSCFCGDLSAAEG